VQRDLDYDHSFYSFFSRIYTNIYLEEDLEIL